MQSLAQAQHLFQGFPFSDQARKLLVLLVQVGKHVFSRGGLMFKVSDEVLRGFFQLLQYAFEVL